MNPDCIYKKINHTWIVYLGYRPHIDLEQKKKKLNKMKNEIQTIYFLYVLTIKDHLI